MIGVAWTGDDASFQGFVDTHGLTFPQINDAGGDLFAKFGVPVQPAWAFVDSDGTVTTRVGAMDDATLDANLEQLASP